MDGTKVEADRIRLVLSNVKILQGKRATKAAVFAASHPLFLHIATHGFFSPDTADSDVNAPAEFSRKVIPEETIPRLDHAPPEQNPLLRSGLELAGNTEEVSRLTALEASSIDLRETELVTLSACDTGLGRVRIGEVSRGYEVL